MISPKAYKTWMCQIQEKANSHGVKTVRRGNSMLRYGLSISEDSVLDNDGDDEDNNDSIIKVTVLPTRKRDEESSRV